MRGTAGSEQRQRRVWDRGDAEPGQIEPQIAGRIGRVVQIHIRGVMMILLPKTQEGPETMSNRLTLTPDRCSSECSS